MGMVKQDDWRLPDILWAQMEPLLPPRKPHPRGCHNPRVSDRATMDVILFVLRTGYQWNALNGTGICSSSSAHWRFQEWVEAGVFEEFWMHGLLMISPGQFRLTPAFDVLPHLEAPNAPQSIGVGAFGCASTLENALSQCGRFFLSPDEAVDVVREVKAVAAGWRNVFREAGATDHDLRMLAACFTVADAAERDVLPPPPSRPRGRRKGV